MPRTGLTAEQIREKAIDCAIERMRQQGFERVRLSDIGRDLGVSHAALYSHFTDKSALLDAVSERWLISIDTGQEQHLQTNNGLSPQERIQAWFLGLHRAKRIKVLHDPELYKAFNYSVEAMKPFVEKHLATTKRQLSELVRQAMSAGQLPIGQNPEKIALLLMETTMGFHHPRLVVEWIEVEREEALLGVLNTVFNGLNH